MRFSVITGYRLIPDIDGFEALLGDAKRHRPSFVIASPDRERATGADLLQQAGADQLIDSLSSGFTFAIRRQFNAAVIALRSRGQNDELRIGQSRHRDPPLGLVRRRSPPPPQPHLGQAAGGAGSRGAPRARNGHSTALFFLNLPPNLM